MSIIAAEYQDRISAIYKEYREVVFPLVAFLEVADSEFPVEILNEIRSIFSHFSRMYADNISDADISSELAKAESHLKRALLDCYKYGCLSLSDFYNAFKKEYRFADLSVIDNGDFLSRITRNFTEGQKLLLEAKISERQNKHLNDLYRKFESAFDMLLKNYNLIYEKIGIIHRVERKAKWTRFWGTFGFWISLALAAAGIILAL
ncbi:MAG: hypothetical protein NC041_07225 [Bacteroides sp.]|nr:hypothetical protein [Prevotella sp.]MCM1407089.1 hypothetical protein [Treponema brennaborense]MCM1470241.1 hypothetical protein [Bacteroides sp.]